MLNEKKKISVVSSCFNEAGNLQAFYNDIVNVMTQFPQYSYEIIMADNCSIGRWQQGHFAAHCSSVTSSLK